MKKIIVYGYGKAYQDIRNHLSGCEIIAYADQKAHELQQKSEILTAGTPFVLPSEISSLEYDYVAISSPGYYEKIKQQLVCENGVDENRVISLRMFADEVTDDRKEVVEKETKWLEELLKEEGSSSRPIVCTRCPEEEPDGKRFSTANALYFVPDWKDCQEDKAKIYVVTHRDYKVFNDKTYIPISVGNYQNDEFISEKSGDNIATLNNKINECTAIYWIWKNVNLDYVGITHYRRYFYNNELQCRENRLDSFMAKNLLKDSDMLVYQAVVPRGETVEEELRGDLSQEAYEYGLRTFREALTKYQPEYISDFYEVLSAKECCYCNMMVAKKEIYDRYCEWLFSFLIPVAEQADVSGFDEHNARVIGFFAERMLSVWLHHNQLKVKSLPVFVP